VSKELTEDEKKHLFGKSRRHHNKTGRVSIQNGTLHKNFDKMIERLMREGIIRKDTQ